MTDAFTRRKFIAALTATTVYAPAVWAAPGITLNPHPSGDDAAQLNAAFTTLRNAGRGWLDLDRLSATPFNIKSPVDMTHLANVELRCSPGAMVRCDGFQVDPVSGVTGPMFDMSNSYWGRIIGSGNPGLLIQGVDGNTTPGTAAPCCAVLAAYGDTKRLENIATSGKFRSCAVGLIACSESGIIGGGIGANQLGETPLDVPTLVISSNFDWGIWSPFTAAPPLNTIPAQSIYLDNTQVQGLGRYLWTIYLRNVHSLRMDNVLLGCTGRSGVLAQGQNNLVAITGGKMYSEFADAAPIAVFECGAGGSCTNIKSLGFGTFGLPMTLGPGNFAGLQSF